MSVSCGSYQLPGLMIGSQPFHPPVPASVFQFSCPTDVTVTSCRGGSAFKQCDWQNRRYTPPNSLLSFSALLQYSMCLCFCPIIDLGLSGRAVRAASWDRSKPLQQARTAVWSAVLLCSCKPSFHVKKTLIFFFVSTWLHRQHNIIVADKWVNFESGHFLYVMTDPLTSDDDDTNNGSRMKMGSGGSDLIFDRMSVETKSLAHQLGAVGHSTPRDPRSGHVFQAMCSIFVSLTNLCCSSISHVWSRGCLIRFSLLVLLW